MTQSPVYFFCDGPACLESADDAGDEDNLVTAGWLLVTFAGQDEDDCADERFAHFHSYACLVAWAAEGAEEESVT